MAVTEHVAPTTRALHVPRPGRGARRFVIGALLGVVIVLAALIAFRQSYAQRILPGIQVGDVAVGGLTAAEARNALVAALGHVETGDVTVRSGVGNMVVSYSDLGRTVDYDAMVAHAATLGREGTLFAETVTGLRLLVEPVSMPAIVTFDRARLTDALAAYSDRVALPARDAGVVAVGTGYAINRAVNGVQVDTGGLAATIEAALLDPATPASVTVSAASSWVAPATSEADAERARGVADRIASDIVLSKGSKKWKIKAATIRPWITFSGVGAGYGPRLDPASVPAALKKVAKDLKRKPTEALYLKSRSGHIMGVSASKLGRAVDKEATAQAVVAALAARGVGSGGDTPVKVKTMVVAPELSTDEAKRKAPLMVKLGTWTTRYAVSAHNGFAANITVPARRLDGVVVKPGQVFDFWNALGEVSFRTGYRLGGAIVGGHSVEGKALAGGICAASTTLFNAAARGGMQIVSRAPHWYYITRYPLGLDATVSESQNMRFRNDTKHSILIKTHASPGIVTFEIWSVPNGRAVSWSRPNVSNVVRGFDTVKKTSSLPHGQSKRIEWPVDGKDVSITRTVRDSNGRLIHRDVFVSHYHRMIGVTLVGK